jgi:hypothetical protein
MHKFGVPWGRAMAILLLVGGLTDRVSTWADPPLHNGDSAEKPPSVSFEQGLRLLARRRYQEAGDLFGKLDGEGTVRARAIAGAGFADFGLERVREAESQMNRALELDPHCALAKVLMGYLLIGKKEFDEARSTVQEALEANPRLALAWQLKGLLATLPQKAAPTASQIPGLLQEAKRCYTRAIELEPELAEAYGARAGLALILAFGIRDESHPGKSRPLSAEQKAEIQDALADANEAIRLDPEYSRAYFVHALLKQTLTNADPVACIPDWCEALKHDSRTRPFLKRLVQASFFPETQEAPGMLEQIETAFKTLNAEGQQEMVDTYTEVEQLTSTVIGKLEDQNRQGKLPEPLAARMEAAKKCRDRASEMFLRVRSKEAK